MCSGGPVAGQSCGLGGAWFCAWSIGTIATFGSSGGFVLKGFSLEGFSVKGLLPLLGQLLWFL